MAFMVSCAPNEESQSMNYPDTRRDSSVVEDYFGTSVADPYRWLEDDRSEETANWVKAENEVTFNYLSTIPYRETIRKRLEELWNYEKYSAPTKHGDWTYFYKNDGLQNQYVLYREKEGVAPEVFLDPNKFSTDGTTSLAGIEFTKDGKFAAYQISEAGSDWRKVIVLDTETKEQIEEPLIDVKFSGLAWKGNDGFYYSSYDKPKEGSALSGMTDQHKLYYHKLGTAQSSDKLIFGGSQTPRRYIGGYVTEDQRYLVITAAVSTTGNELYIQDLSKDGNIISVVGNFDNEHGIVHTDGTTLYISTNFNAPNSKLVKTDLNSLGQENWVDVIPEKEFPMSISTGGGYFFVNYLKDATSRIEQYNVDGSLVREVELPGVGSAGGLGGEWDEKEMYYSFTNYIYPPTIFSFNPDNGQSEVYKKAGVKFNSDDYTTEQVFYTSKDGVKVPMIITYKKGIERNGNNPTILYGYGGFGVNLTPSFSTSYCVWLEQGGILAVPNLRGGGEYGEEWHKAGTKMQKQNVFNDFIAAGEYLISEKYTSSDFLAVSGGSNGGLLVGAVMTQRPDLMRVALPAVGVLDMLRYHKFTAGAGWAYDYGTSEDSEEMFNYLYEYSPVHNVKQGTCYPATMVTTADHDDRVVPAHSFKFAAELQRCQSCNNPTLIRIETNAGHGAGKPTSKIIEEAADKFAFTWWNMGVKEMK